MIEGYLIKEYVLKERSQMPRLGGKKLYHKLKPVLAQHAINIGRDKFFSWLRNEELLVHPKRRFVKTTNSHHRFYKYTNLIKDKAITAPDDVWVSDITYLRLQKGFCYLALITDVYSRKIIGFDVNDSLELSGCIRALAMACKTRVGSSMTIHHSDRGIQYCSNRYVEIMKKNAIEISMGEVGNCYENAIAERINGILKGEFNLDASFKDLEQAKIAACQAVKTYNEQRPHMALRMRTPIELYAA